jgi:hypothetical protein
VAKTIINKHLLNSTGVITQAIVIIGKNSLGNNNVSRETTYSYKFLVNREPCIGNTNDKKHKSGDVI